MKPERSYQGGYHFYIQQFYDCSLHNNQVGSYIPFLVDECPHPMQFPKSLFGSLHNQWGHCQSKPLTAILIHYVPNDHSPQQRMVIGNKVNQIMAPTNGTYLFSYTLLTWAGVCEARGVVGQDRKLVNNWEDLWSNSSLAMVWDPGNGVWQPRCSTTNI